MEVLQMRSLGLLVVAGLVGCSEAPVDSESRTFAAAIATSEVFASGDVSTTLVRRADGAVVASVDWNAADRTLRLEVDSFEKTALASPDEAAPTTQALNRFSYDAWLQYGDVGTSTDEVRRGPGYDDVEPNPGGGAPRGGGVGSGGGGGGGGSNPLCQTSGRNCSIIGCAFCPGG